MVDFQSTIQGGVDRALTDSLTLIPLLGTDTL